MRYELGIDAAKLDAIDMHVHLEVDSCGHGSLPTSVFQRMPHFVARTILLRVRPLIAFATSSSL